MNTSENTTSNSTQNQNTPVEISESQLFRLIQEYLSRHDRAIMQVQIKGSRSREDSHEQADSAGNVDSEDVLSQTGSDSGGFGKSTKEKNSNAVCGICSTRKVNSLCSNSSCKGCCASMGKWSCSVHRNNVNTKPPKPISGIGADSSIDMILTDGNVTGGQSLTQVSTSDPHTDPTQQSSAASSGVSSISLPCPFCEKEVLFQIAFLRQHLHSCKPMFFQHLPGTESLNVQQLYELAWSAGHPGSPLPEIYLQVRTLLKAPAETQTGQTSFNSNQSFIQSFKKLPPSGISDNQFSEQVKSEPTSQNQMQHTQFSTNSSAPQPQLSTPIQSKSTGLRKRGRPPRSSIAPPPQPQTPQSQPTIQSNLSTKSITSVPTPVVSVSSVLRHKLSLISRPLFKTSSRFSPIACMQYENLEKKASRIPPYDELDYIQSVNRYEESVQLLNELFSQIEEPQNDLKYHFNLILERITKEIEEEGNEKAYKATLDAKIAQSTESIQEFSKAFQGLFVAKTGQELEMIIKRFSSTNGTYWLSSIPGVIRKRKLEEVSKSAQGSQPTKKPKFIKM